MYTHLYVSYIKIFNLHTHTHLKLWLVMRWLLRSVPVLARAGYIAALLLLGSSTEERRSLGVAVPRFEGGGASEGRESRSKGGAARRSNIQGQDNHMVYVYMHDMCVCTVYIYVYDIWYTYACPALDLLFLDLPRGPLACSPIAGELGGRVAAPPGEAGALAPS